MTLHDDREPLEITSLTNPRVKHLVDLRRRRTRDADGVTLLEGHGELSLALQAGVTPRELYFSPDLVRDALPVDALERVRAAGTTIWALSEPAFRKVSYRESPDGWLAVVDNPARPLDSLELRPDALVLVCEAIEKPGNLGAMLRTADAVGVDAVIAASPVADWGNPNVIRASKGTVFVVPVASADSEVVVEWLGSHGTRIVVATPEATTLVTETDLTGPTAIVVGAESDGVTDIWHAAAAVGVRLPMFGQVNSLNVSISAGVALYEAVRQRSLASSGGGLHRRDELA